MIQCSHQAQRRSVSIGIRGGLGVVCCRIRPVLVIAQGRTGRGFRLRDGVFLGHRAAGISGPRQRSVIDVHAVGNGAIRRADNVDSLRSFERRSREAGRGTARRRNT